MIKSIKGKTTIEGTGAEILADLHVLAIDTVYTICKQSNITPDEIEKDIIKEMKKGFVHAEEMLKAKDPHEYTKQQIKKILNESKDSDLFDLLLNVLLESNDKEDDE